MTPEERAKAIADNIPVAESDHYSTDAGKLALVIAGAIRAAVAEERERCATLAEELAKALQARGAGRPAVFVVEQMAVGIRQGF